MSFPFELYIQKAKQLNHSEEFINATIAYARNLDDRNLPVIFTIEHFSDLIRMPSFKVKEIIQYRANQYSRFRINKKVDSKAFRYLMAPDAKLKYIQRWINKNILQKIELSDNCTAYIPGKSVFLNGYIHRNADQILKVDLLKFFDCITEQRVFSKLKWLCFILQLIY